MEFAATETFRRMSSPTGHRRGTTWACLGSAMPPVMGRPRTMTSVSSSNSAPRAAICAGNPPDDIHVPVSSCQHSFDDTTHRRTAYLPHQLPRSGSPASLSHSPRFQQQDTPVCRNGFLIGSPDLDDLVDGGLVSWIPGDYGAAWLPDERRTSLPRTTRYARGECVMPGPLSTAPRPAARMKRSAR